MSLWTLQAFLTMRTPGSDGNSGNGWQSGNGTGWRFGARDAGDDCGWDFAIHRPGDLNDGLVQKAIQIGLLTRRSPDIDQNANMTPELIQHATFA